MWNMNSAKYCRSSLLQSTRKFNITDWGPISSFLGINMHYDKAAGVLGMDVIEKVQWWHACAIVYRW